MGARQGLRESETWSEGSETYVILGLRVPTTGDEKKFDDNRYWLGVPTTCK